MHAGPLRRRATAAGVTAIALAASACSTETGGGIAVPPTPKSVGDMFSVIQEDPQLNALLPPDVRTARRLTVATDPSKAPNEFLAADNTTITGFDADLGKALGRKLGVEFAFGKAESDTILPGVASGTYNLGMSSLTDNAVRERTVDFVTYFTAGSSLMVKQGNPKTLKPDDLSLCGKEIAVEKGTVQLDELARTIVPKKGLGARTKTCTDRGKPPPIARPYPDQSAANQALATGRADAVLADSPVVDYAVKQSRGQFEASGAPYNPAPYGIAVGKKLGRTKDAVLGAVKALQTDGTYTKILTKWALQAGADANPVINAGAQG